ncbi:CHAT domain-containing protein [Streptomyces glaucosporus]|uniref:CHAT domain-containing protein n=1 Tax=Streptomyces glaucosporus TaxID=284044 RepID=A0ABP5V313_9ACTN
MGTHEECPLAAVQARLARVEATGERGLLLEPAAAEEAAALARSLPFAGSTGGFPERLVVLAVLHLQRHGARAASGVPGGEDLDVAKQLLAPLLRWGDPGRSASSPSVSAERAIPMAAALSRLVAEVAGAEALFPAVANLWRRVLATASTDPVRAACLTNLAGLYLWHFHVSGRAADLDQAVGHARRAVDLCTEGTSAMAVARYQLAGALSQRARLGTHRGDVDEALAQWRLHAELLPGGHPERGRAREQVVSLLLHRYWTRPGTDPTELVNACRTALEEGGEPEGILLVRSVLAAALIGRYERLGERDDLEMSISHARGVLREKGLPREWAGELNENLCLALTWRYGLTGDAGDLLAAVEAGWRAVKNMPPRDSDGTGLSNLGEALRMRFERFRRIEDLNAAVDMHRRAVDCTDDVPSRRAAKLSNLSVALRIRWEQTGRSTDLDQAIEAAREAYATARTGDPKLPVILANLGHAYACRYRRDAMLADLDHAVDAARKAISAAGPSHPDRPGFLSNLGLHLLRRHERTKRTGDVKEALAVADAAAAAAAGRSKRWMYLMNLASAHLTVFDVTGERRELEAAIDRQREGVEHLPPDHPGRCGSLGNLTQMLRILHETTQEPSFLDDAVGTGRASLRAAQGSDRSIALAALAPVWDLRFRLSGRDRDRRRALAAYAEVLGTATAGPTERVDAARLAARLTGTRAPGQAADLLETAVLLLPRMTPRQLGRDDAQHAVSRVGGLATDAAAFALADPAGTATARAMRALRLLEAGRAVLLSRALDTRSELTDLEVRHRKLADEFRAVRDLLDLDTAPGQPLTASRAEGREHYDRVELARRFDDVLSRIRACRHFESFALPPTAEELLAEAHHGPVVVFNVGSHRSDALLLTENGITSLALPGLTRGAVSGAVRAFQRELARAMAPTGDRVAAQQALHDILQWLWTAAAKPVLDALAPLLTPRRKGGSPPRVWWVTGGLLGLLPLHAAGHHTGPLAGRGHTVLDRVVSSYAPTVRSLRHARRAGTGGRVNGGSLIVAMPTTPGLPETERLWHAQEEAAAVAAHLPDAVTLVEPADPAARPDALPTAAHVLDLLPGCSIAHFACHGTTDPADPSRSGLLLHDHPERLLTVRSLTPLKLSRARLAYLSACSTAVNDRSDLIDEAIHLTGAFHLAGFPHVVGTRWAIDDALAARVAETFYAGLRGPGNVLDPDRAADALHGAVRDLRDRFPRTPSLWAAHLHVGP